MRILIDARVLKEQTSGTAIFTRQLLTALLERDPQNHYSLVVTAREDGRGMDEKGNCDLLAVGIDYRQHPLNEWWLQVQLPRLLEQHGADFFLSSCYQFPRRRLPCRSAVWLYDFGVFRIPRNWPWQFALYLRWMIGGAVKRADYLLLPSRFSLAELQRLFPRYAEKGRVIPPGLEQGFIPWDASKKEEFRRRLHLPERYVLYVANYEMRKNFPVLLRAFQMIRARQSHFKLLLIGRGLRNFRLKKEAAAAGITDYLLFRERVGRDELPGYYNCATLLIYPSFYEGFGLPVLEAMGCGLMVVAARGVVAEELSPHIFLFNPHDAHDVAAQALVLLENEGRRAELAARLHESVLNFTWTRSAHMLLSLIRGE